MKANRVGRAPDLCQVTVLGCLNHRSYTHFTDLETEVQSGKVMLKFTQHAQPGIWEIWLPSRYSLLHISLACPFREFLALLNRQ